MKSYPSFFLVLVLTSCTPSSSENPDVSLAEKISIVGHGIIFDSEMNRIEIDSPLIPEIQDSMLGVIFNTYAGDLPKGTADKLKEAQRLLNSGDLNKDEKILVKSGIIDLLLQSAPEALASKYRWRNNLIASYYLTYLDGKLDRDPDSVRPLRSGVMDFFPQVRPGSLASEEDGSAYLEECRSQAVPTPPIWEETGTDWVFQGELTQILLEPENGAGVWTYSDPTVRGACVAVQRGDGSFETTFAIICQSASTGRACFWDNELKDDTSGQHIGWKGLRLDPRLMRDGTDLPEEEACMECHRGNSVFIMLPDDPTWAKLMRGPLSGPITGTFTTQVESSTDNQGEHPRFIPIPPTRPFGNWENTFAEGGCSGACHEAPPEKIMEFFVGTQVAMPPECALPSTTDPENCYTPRHDIKLPASISFGSVAQKDVSTRTITISNVGTEELLISLQASGGPPIGQPPSGFFWKSLSATVPPGKSEVLTVDFMPRAEGIFKRELSISSNVPEGPHTVRLSGRGRPASGPAGPIEPN